MKYLLFLLNLNFVFSQYLNESTYPNPASDQLLFYSKSHPKPPIITSSSGIPLDDIENTLSAGQNGPLVMDTTFFRELQSFARERTTPRIIFAKGAGAFGYLEITGDISNYTMAKMFSQVGQKIPVTVRFSRQNADPGRPDTIRDFCGFSVRFHTEDGNWDLVGGSQPESWIRDPLQFPSLLHSMRANPVTNLPDPNSFWDFITLNPETIISILSYFSDYGIPRSYRQIHGFGIHAYQLVNAVQTSYFAKFTFISNQGLDNLPLDEAATMAGTLPDIYIQDLYNNIAWGNLPSWDMTAQIVTSGEANSFPFNPFDPTKDWNTAAYPPVLVGKLVLTTNPSNYFTDVENLAFNPGNLVPGIQPSPDKLFQGRIFAYNDAQTYRLGVNGNSLRANAPVSQPNNYLRDGFARYGSNQNGAVNYYPNSFNGPVTTNRSAIVPYTVSGEIGSKKSRNLIANAKNTPFLSRYNTSNELNFFETGAVYLIALSDNQRLRLTQNIASSLSQAYPNLQVRALNLLYQVSPELGKNLQKALIKAGLPSKYVL